MDVVLSLSWNSAYQSVRGLVAHLAAGWRTQGLEMIELDISQQGWIPKLRDLLKERRVRFVLCTSGVGAHIEVEGANIWASIKLPVFSFLLDHPAYYPKHHVSQPVNTVLGYMFEDHALYQHEVVKAHNSVTSLHFGVPDLPVAARQDGRPRVVFAKTGNAPAALAESWRAAPKLERILRDALDELGLERSGNAHVAAFAEILPRVCAARHLYLQPYSQLGRFLFAQLDDYVRRLKSTAMAKALLPFEVDVFGSAWDHIDTDGARAKFHGPVDYATVESQFPGATASLTMNPNIDHSAHDRFFTALGAGIMPVSDGNAYTAKNFPELAPYSFDFRPGSLEAVLERVFAAPERARELARVVRERGRRAHGVEAAAANITMAMQGAAMAAVPRQVQNFFVP